MKRFPALAVALLTVLSLTGCGNSPAPQNEDICPGKQVGSEGVSPTRAEGFDETEDMSFTTVDTRGNSVTDEIFDGSKRGVWLLFWQTGNEKSAAALAQLERLLPDAEENGYKIIGVVMDGEKYPEAAADMTDDLHFDNLIWNDEMAQRYEGISDFFDGTHYEENQEDYAQMNPRPHPGDPISTRTNSRGQLQTACTLVPLTDEQILSRIKEFDSNMTYDELMEETNELLKK